MDFELSGKFNLVPESVGCKYDCLSNENHGIFFLYSQCDNSERVIFSHRLCCLIIFRWIKDPPGSLPLPVSQIIGNDPVARRVIGKTVPYLRKMPPITRGYKKD
jgi:hypothetical protein